MADRNKHKVCVGIVTYNPNIQRLRESIESISKQVNEVVICDNGSFNVNEIKEIVNEYSCDIIENSDNKGIAFALNELCKYAYENGYGWILTLDQDSVCPMSLVESLLIHCSEDAAVVGPRIIYEGNEEYSYTSSKRIHSLARLGLAQSFILNRKEPGWRRRKSQKQLKRSSRIS